MIYSVCVFCSSSDRIDRRHFELAQALGDELVTRGLTLVYGGGGVGLMGALARSVSRQNGKIIGVIPDFMRARELAFEEADELVVTATMRERKAEMEARADAFIVLPGGFGTLEEVVEIITLKQLAIHHKPIVFVNQCGFFDPLLVFFERIFEQDFTRPLYRNFYKVAQSLEETFDYFSTYQADPSENHWHITT
jgi:cytokinin riboside 5'-monophosphate phosphoribohydrolase